MSIGSYAQFATFAKSNLLLQGCSYQYRKKPQVKSSATSQVGQSESESLKRAHTSTHSLHCPILIQAAKSSELLLASPIGCKHSWALTRIPSYEVRVFMLDINIIKSYKSIAAGASFELPDFSVITGRNGSGKTHLLELLESQGHSSVKSNGVKLRDIEFFKFGALVAEVNAVHDPAHLTELDRHLWSQIEGLQKQYLDKKNETPSLTEADFFQDLKPHIHVQQEVMNLLHHASTEGIPLLQLNQENVFHLNYGFTQLNEKSIFSASLATIFNTYSIRKYKNLFQRFLHEKGESLGPGFTDDEFREKFGPEPWELVNDILKRAGLTYQVVPPNQNNSTHIYRLQLIDEHTGAKISLTDLSTGERVLMALGLAIYRTKEDAGKPEVLLLDEPDAPLHPEFSRLLVEVLREIVVGQAGVRVIMSTHSPSTLAICPEEAVFEMKREIGRPQKISLQKGVQLLTVGIPHLRISTEPRRQIFVESKYDVCFFNRLFDMLHRCEQFNYEPVFLQPHSKSSNCTGVQQIVSKLAAAGNDLVRGIVDRDAGNKVEAPLFILGNGGRYAIENYILDPLFIALALIKFGRKRFSDFGVMTKHRYTEAVDLTQEEAQYLANSVLSTAGALSEDTVESSLLNGWTVVRPRDFLDMKGHDWEDLIMKKLPELNALTRGRTEEDKLKRPVLGVVEDFPDFLPVEVRSTLEKLL